MSNIIGTLPVTLQNGTTADASQVMSDFNYIVNQVNANALAVGFLAPGTFLSAQVFFTPGTATYTPNANATKAFIYGVGAGGGGGGAAPTGVSTTSVGNGGNSGAFGIVLVTSITTTTVTIGAGGAAGASSGGAGGVGGLSSFGGFAIFPGGNGGQPGAATAPPYVNQSALATTNVSGTGQILINGWNMPGEYGMSLSTASNIGGKGANSAYGLGVGNRQSGIIGNGFGTGGTGGAQGVGGPGQAGSAGTQGLILVLEYA